MAIRLIALDIDGTLVDTNNEISPANEMAVKKALNSEIKVVLVTGRHHDGVKKLMEVLDLDSKTLLVLNNGALIYSGNTILWKDILTADETDKVIRFSTKLSGVVTTIFQPDNIELYCNPPFNKEWLINRLEAFEMRCGKVAQSAQDLTRENVAKVMLITESSEKALEVFKVWPKGLSHLNLTRSYPYLCEINSSTCDKGHGLEILCNKIGIPPDEVLAVGDGESDIPMLSFAGNAVFVRHYDYVPKLPPHVEVTPKGFENKATAWALEKYLGI